MFIMFVLDERMLICFQLFCSFNCGENWHDPVKCKVCWGNTACLKSLRSARIAQHCYQCLYINMLSCGFVLLCMIFEAFHCQQCLLCFSQLSTVLAVISGWPTWIILFHKYHYLFNFTTLIWSPKPFMCIMPTLSKYWGKMSRMPR